MATFPRAIQICTQNIQTSHGDVFRISKHCATQLSSFTYFKMLLLAVVKCLDPNLVYQANCPSVPTFLSVRASKVAKWKIGIKK